MNRLGLEELRDRADEQVAAALATPGISAFCSAAPWQLAAHGHLHPAIGGARALVAERDGAWLLFAEREQPGVFLPLEAAWMFGCPLVGEPEAAAALLLDAVREERARRQRPLAFFLGGLARDGAIHRAVEARGRCGDGLRVYPGTDVMLIDLVEGVEAWLARRSRKFRRSLRAVGQEASDIEIDDASRDAPERSLARLLGIQRRSYKWREGSDIFQMPEFAAFYRALFLDLHARGALRLLFARRDGVDLAHIFGGVLGTSYRGLQMSYAEEVRDLGLGNLLQLENLRRCAAEGIVEYDLGMHSPYKERWADRLQERIGVLWTG